MNKTMFLEICFTEINLSLDHLTIYFLRLDEMWMRVFVSLALILLTVHGAAVKKEPTKVPTDQKPKEPDNTEEVDFSGEWECGGEDFSKLISQQMIEKDCPKLLRMYLKL